MSCPKVSIICPVYNAEKYIHRCVDSIIAQTLTDWELILVDDGSKDKSGAICDEYAQKDPRIRVIHKENGGVSMARQTGVEAATGEFLIHADPDDYVEPEMLEEMVSEIEHQGVDILVTDFYVDRNGKPSELKKQTFEGSTCKELSEEILFQRLHGSLWNKIVRQSCYRASAPQFFPGVNYCEDVLIWVQMSRFNVSVGYLPKAYYHYVVTSGSITQTMNMQNLAMRKQFVEKLKELCVAQEYIDYAAMAIKILALYSNLLTRKEYYNFYPCGLKTVIRFKYLHERMFGFFASLRLYYLGGTLFKLYQSASNLKMKIK